jgi:hypothetical protein
MNEDVNPVPSLPESIPYNINTTKSVKVATPDIVLFNEDAQSVEAMADLIFENIGGQEIINISRQDIIDGKNVDYSLISNLDKISARYNPKNILNVSGTLEQYFKNFAIRLDLRIPENGTGPDGKYVYIDNSQIANETVGIDMGINSGSLVVEVIGMKSNEQVEVQVLNSGEYLDGIIGTLEEF